MAVRDGIAGLEVFVLQRAATMTFAPGAVVFPGGGRDRADSSIEETAVRELFEECGVLLAENRGSDVGRPSGSDAPVGHPHAWEQPGWEECRIALTEHRTTLAQVLQASGLTARTDLLYPWARWVTPQFLPQRYDTHFFVTVVPDGQQPRHVGGESVQSGWVPVAHLLAEAEGQPGNGQRLLPPTHAVLLELAHAGSVARVFATRPPMQPRLTELIEEDGVLYLQLTEARAPGETS